MARLKYYTEKNNGVTTIYVQNHSKRHRLFASNDEQLVKNRMKEIREDLNKAEKDGVSYSDFMIQLYSWAKRYGCVVLMTPGTGTPVLKMRPVENKCFVLVISKDKKEYVLKKGPFQEVSAKLKEWNAARKENPAILYETWNYLEAKQREAKT